MRTIDAFELGQKYGVIEGTKGYIITTNDLVHCVYKPDETANLLTGWPAEKWEPFTLDDILRIAKPVTIKDFVHYWGIKPRVYSNYYTLIRSMKEIGADVSDMPEWGKD